MFDAKASIEWLSGALLAPRDTWRRYASKDPEWKYTAINLALPLLVLAWVGFVVMSALFTRGFFGMGFLAVVRGLLFGALVLAMGGYLFGFLAGQFGGRQSFDRGFAAVTLAAVPGQLGSVVSPLPWIGWLLSLAAAVYSLVLLYQIQPVFLDVPDDKRVAHFVVGLIGLIVLVLVTSAILFGGGPVGFRRF